VGPPQLGEANLWKVTVKFLIFYLFLRESILSKTNSKNTKIEKTITVSKPRPNDPHTIVVNNDAIKTEPFNLAPNPCMNNIKQTAQPNPRQIRLK
jgi:hypothetical protein